MCLEEPEGCKEQPKGTFAEKMMAPPVHRMKLIAAVETAVLLSLMTARKRVKAAPRRKRKIYQQ